MIIIKTKSEPYIGPRPFKRDKQDQSRFFGRDTETDEIVSLITSHRLVLVYAQSGAGKTSIFNAQVTPALESYGFEVLPSARVQVNTGGTVTVIPSITDNTNTATTAAAVTSSNNTTSTNTLISLSKDDDNDNDLSSSLPLPQVVERNLYIYNALQSLRPINENEQLIIVNNKHDMTDNIYLFSIYTHNIYLSIWFVRNCYS